MLQFNRAERRAIERGEGRNEPFIEIYDLDDADRYLWACDYASHMLSWICMIEKRMWIEKQIDLDGIRDEFYEVGF